MAFFGKKKLISQLFIQNIIYINNVMIDLVVVNKNGHFGPFLSHFGPFLGNFGIFWQFFKIFCQLIWCSHSCYYLGHLGNPKMATFTYFQLLTQCCHFLLFFRLAYQFSPLREGNLGWHKKI